VPSNYDVVISDTAFLDAEALGSEALEKMRAWCELIAASGVVHPRDEFLLGLSPETRRAPLEPKRPGEEDLRAKVTELERKLAEAERMNRAQGSRLIEERRAASTANRMNDQLQMRLDRQIDIINERARANDAALAALAAKDQGRLLAFEVLHGEVIDISGAEVVVRFDTGDDVVEQTYDLNQFTLGRAPVVGDQLAAYVHITVAPPSPMGPVSESKGETHESPRPRRNVITGDHRF
jgi:hypothetical protein